MPPAPSTLPELVEQLGRTFSPFERLKILTRAWGLLRRMSPDERLRVAAQLGLDHADDLVESLAERRGGTPPPALLAMIEKAQMKGTAHLPELVADLRDPKRRGERLTEGTLRAVEATLAGGGAAPPPPPRRAVPAPAPPPSPPPPPQQAAPPTEVSPAPPSPPAPAALPPAAPAAPAAPVAAAPAEPPRPEPAPPAPPPAPLPAKPAAGDGALAGRLAATPSVLARFRLLRDHLEGSKRPPAGDLRALLDVFPDGWARRRALAALLEAGLPEKAADAVPLLSALSSERDRLWCLGTLASSRPISETDRETLLGTVTSPAARRRLERRLGKLGSLHGRAGMK